eukprot:CAMPEP_0172322098 /NCGR_PEP_ID=MMETSP1058-20130122/45025_1 /TAXON_ID=83371 /ORGANISM="Detonula confervacea, Strain CCMP 353" /LENGTH=370 /DNA_ID=CAMNT_0013037747 /DNA_START=139 /DNA_END=1251 /DNA_ORIENTATION=+
MGATPCFDDAIPAKYIFLSHGHVDHVGGMFSHARAHAVSCGGEAPTYFVPAQLLPQIEQCRDAMSLLDASNIPHPGGEGEEGCGGRTKSLIKMKLVPVHAGDEILLKGINYGSKTSFFVRAFEVDHAGHPALGYIIGSRTTTGLKAEYQNLDGAKLRDLVKSGVSIKANPIEKIEVGYTGDTCARGLIKRSIYDDNVCQSLTENGGVKQESSFDIEQLFQAELLFCELTFLDSSEDDIQRSKASERGHIHINDLSVIFSSHDPSWEESDDTTTTTTHGGDGKADSNPSTCQYPKNIVFYHLSAKYQPARRALDFIAEGLSRQLRGRCHVAISSMLSHDEKSCEDSIARLIQSNGCISLAEYLSWKDSPTI